jgi:hypothetical protein
MNVMHCIITVADAIAACGFARAQNRKSQKYRRRSRIQTPRHGIDTTMISRRDLTRLPGVDRFRAVLQSMAMLDAILSPEWQYRYYSFNSRWSAGEQMGSMRDGCGDSFFALFNAAGCFLKGFAHESPMSPYCRRPKGIWSAVIDNVPAEFAACLQEPAFNIEETTFCIWRRYSDKSWQCGAIEFPAATDPVGSASLLSPLDGQPASYQAWAEKYYERAVALTAVKHVYAHKPLSEKVVQKLNSDLLLKELAKDIQEIGYPGCP